MLNRNNLILSFIIFSIIIKENIFLYLYDNLKIATPFPKQLIQDPISFPQWSNVPFLVSYLYSTNTTTCLEVFLNALDVRSRYKVRCDTTIREIWILRVQLSFSHRCPIAWLFFSPINFTPFFNVFYMLRMTLCCNAALPLYCPKSEVVHLPR